MTIFQMQSLRVNAAPKHVASILTLGLAAPVLCCAAATFAQTKPHDDVSFILPARQQIVVDDAGAHIVKASFSFAERTPAEPAEALGSGGIFWQYTDPYSIVNSVALGASNSESWVAHDLNDCRLSKFTTNGGGVPDFVYNIAAESPDCVITACAENASLAVLVRAKQGIPIKVRALTAASGPTPIWTYTFPAGFTTVFNHGANVSADGSIVAVAAVAYNIANPVNSQSQIVTLNGANGEIINATQLSGICANLELSDDGSRMVVNQDGIARVFHTATMTSLYSLDSASNATAWHRLSRNGEAVVAGGFNFAAAREVNGVWSVVYTGTGSGEWFGYSMAISGDSSTMFAASLDYIQNYLPNHFYVVDLNTAALIASSTQTGIGNLQNSMWQAEASANGTIFAAASWGDEAHSFPQVRLFDRNLNLIGGVDTPGSPFAIDLSPDGKFLLVGSKAMHANAFGYGGQTHLYQVPPWPADITGDGSVDIDDLISVITHWGPCPSLCLADLDHNGVVNSYDLLAVITQWN